MPRSFREIIDEGQLNAYMAMLADCVAPLVPPDALFTIVLHDRNRPESHYVSNAARDNCAARLRDLANALEADARRDRGQAEKN